MTSNGFPIQWPCDSRVSSFCLEGIFPMARGKEEICTAISPHRGPGVRNSTSVDETTGREHGACRLSGSPCVTESCPACLGRGPAGGDRMADM